MIIIFSGFLLRIALSIYNIDIGLLPGAEADAGWFHWEAIRYSEYLDQKQLFPESTWRYEVGWSYAVFLGYLYNFFGTESWYLSGFLSCFVWLLSALVFRKIMLKIKLNKININFAILIYTFLIPTSIIYTAITLREVYILLFLNVFTLLIVNIYYEKKIIKILLNIIFMFVAIILLLLLHRANFYFFIVFFTLIIIFYFINKFNISKITQIILASLTLFFLSYYGYTEIIFNAVKNYQMGHFNEIPDRAAYYEKNMINNIDYDLISFFVLLCKNFFSYFVEPTFFKIANIKDAVLFFENIIRAVLIFLIFKKILLQFKSKTLFIIFLTIFISMEFLYSQGTVNWGTASRHHVPVMGILILSAFFPLRKVKQDKRLLLIK